MRKDQAVDNIDKAEIVQIIDDQKLGVSGNYGTDFFQKSAGRMYSNDSV